MMTGTIKRLVRDRGFGFLTADRTGTEHFFHKSGLDHSLPYESLTEGMRVTFEIGESPKGPRAEAVKAEA